VTRCLMGTSVSGELQSDSYGQAVAAVKRPKVNAPFAFPPQMPQSRKPLGVDLPPIPERQKGIRTSRSPSTAPSTAATCLRLLAHPTPILRLLD
jgi:hypothetical protein